MAVKKFHAGVAPNRPAILSLKGRGGKGDRTANQTSRPRSAAPALTAASRQLLPFINSHFFSCWPSFFPCRMSQPDSRFTKLGQPGRGRAFPRAVFRGSHARRREAAAAAAGSEEVGPRGPWAAWSARSSLGAS